MKDAHGRCPAQGTRCRKCNQWNHWEQVCKINKQDQRTKPSPRKKPEAEKPQDKASQNKVDVVEETSSDFDELCFETIQIDSSSFNLGGLCKNQSRTAKC